MTSAKALELQITRHLLQRPKTPGQLSSSSRSTETAPGPTRWGDRLIAILAVTVSLVVVGSYLEELIWVVMAAATIFVIGVDK